MEVKLIVPEGVDHIDDGFWYDITTVDLPESLESIGRLAFANMKANFSKMPPNLRVIEHYAFLECVNITSLEFSDALEVVCEGAFKGCSRLESITFGSGIKKIGDNAFEGCSKLKMIIINKPKGSLDLSNTGIPKGTDIYWKVDSTEEPVVEEKPSYLDDKMKEYILSEYNLALVNEELYKSFPNSANSWQTKEFWSGKLDMLNSLCGEFNHYIVVEGGYAVDVVPIPDDVFR